MMSGTRRVELLAQPGWYREESLRPLTGTEGLCVMCIGDDGSMYEGLIGFIGAGNMAHAMVHNLVRGGVVLASQIVVANKQNERRITELVDSYGVGRAKSVDEIVRRCSTLILATKPFQVAEAMEPVAGSFSPGQLLVSLAAGVSMSYLKALTGPGVQVVRAMPNTPVEVGEGVVVLSRAEDVPECLASRVEALFERAGRVFWASEEQMDLITAISGSGPAYFYLLAEQLARAGTQMGLEQSLSRELARQTLVGAGELLKRSDRDAEELLRLVVTPGGTTAAALRVFEARHLGEVVAEAISSAARRSGEMAGVTDRLEIKASRRIVAKLGSSTVVGADGDFNHDTMAKLVAEMAHLHHRGRQIILVSSGAIACAKRLFAHDASSGLSDKQALSAIGQPLLMRYYESAFEAHGIAVAQVLLTREDFDNPKRAELCRSTLLQLLSRGIIPIINENDTVAIDEIVLGDNDTLSSRVAILIASDLLVLLTDTDGLYTKDPKIADDAHVISQVTPQDTPGADSIESTGGMITKLRAARLASDSGIPVVIANGSSQSVLSGVLEGREIGTFFPRRRAAGSDSGPTRERANDHSGK